MFLYKISVLTPVYLLNTPIAETPRHGDIVVDTENVLQTVFVYITENSCCFHQCMKNCLQLSDSFC